MSKINQEALHVLQPLNTGSRLISSCLAACFFVISNFKGDTMLQSLLLFLPFLYSYRDKSYLLDKF